MNSLELMLMERLAAGLKRTSITKPSDWACMYRVMGGDTPGKWSFERFPWLKEMHDSSCDFNVGLKAAQMGFSETMLNMVLYTIDVKNKDCLYVLPSKTPDASDFSAARFDAALELSSHLAQLFSDVRNVGHKRAGSANLYIRGSQSRAGLKSIPVSLLILDEVEEMVQENIPLAMERLSGQLEKLIWMVSTPTIPNKGIHKYFMTTNQQEFFFPCPSCSRQINLVFPESLIITADDPSDPNLRNTHLICTECKCKLPHETKKSWLKNAKYVAAKPTITDKNGYTVSQMYSTTVKPYELAESYFRGLTNPSDETEFFNSKLGKVHIVDGARVTDTMIQSCIKDHRTTDPVKPGIITMGVDVGKWLHYEIDYWNLNPKAISSIDMNMLAICKVIAIGKVKNFEDLDLLMRRYCVLQCVIDANPERRKAFEFSMRFNGLVKLCFYGRGINGKQIKVDMQTVEPTIMVDRTSWLDLSLGRFKNNTIRLPVDTSLEYKEHIKAPIRVYGKDANDNPVGSYEKGDNDEDHFAHARNYAEIALPFATSSAGVSQDIKVNQ